MSPDYTVTYVSRPDHARPNHAFERSARSATLPDALVAALLGARSTGGSCGRPSTREVTISRTVSHFTLALGQYRGGGRYVESLSARTCGPFRLRPPSAYEHVRSHSAAVCAVKRLLSGGLRSLRDPRSNLLMPSRCACGSRVIMLPFSPTSPLIMISARHTTRPSGGHLMAGDFHVGCSANLRRPRLALSAARILFQLVVTDDINIRISITPKLVRSDAIVCRVAAL